MVEDYRLSIKLVISQSCKPIISFLLPGRCQRPIHNPPNLIICGGRRGAAGVPGGGSFFGETHLPGERNVTGAWLDWGGQGAFAFLHGTDRYSAQDENNGHHERRAECFP